MIKINRVRVPAAFCRALNGLKWALLGFALLASSSPGTAAVPGSAFADTTLAPPTRQDTARALHRLFAQRRSRLSWEGLAASGANLLFANYALAFARHETPGQRVSTGLLVGALGLEIYVFGKALVQLRRYRPAREKPLLAALARGQPLPYRVRRKLVEEYLRPQSARPGG